MSSKLSVRVVRRAAREIAEASAWWDVNRPEAPAALREELQRAFDVIATHPRIGASVLNTKLMGVRRLHLSRIHYHLYYRVRLSPEVIEVLALWHTSRGSGPGL
ncbi:MAG: type II toxin-antitoxin system RelE/ParE family toxin [Deinococcota bacterium]|nr:type II toxin-antitoxin system RelE/ParE family toxin [Deinococcota bacterium]